MKKKYFHSIISRTFILPALLLLAGMLICSVLQAEVLPPAPEQEIPGPLGDVPIPPVPGLHKFIRNHDKAVTLGKALFWDMQAGSDGQACASCHFHAGADNRIKNQLNPASLHRQRQPKSETFDPTASGGSGGPNYTLLAADFPFHRKQDSNDRDSSVLFDSDDRVSSQGVFRRNLVSTDPDPASRNFQDLPFETCETVDDIFHVNGINTRRVAARNTPTMINAVFNFRNFWDGRANNVFNGVDPFGRRNRNAFVLRRNAAGELQKRKVTGDLSNSSLASQAVGPPLSFFEMSCNGRAFPQLGRKLLALRPLQHQQVAEDDSVLGQAIHLSGKGLGISYRTLIEQAFKPRWWDSDTLVDQDGNPVADTLVDQDGNPVAGCAVATNELLTQMEFNFSLFWGLAIQLYESTLISDQAPFDRFAAGKNRALTRQQKRGFAMFLTKGKCINCHKGSDFTGAGSHLQAENQEGGLVERMLMGDQERGAALYDNGFYNIGVRPTHEDIGLGAKDPFNKPLSFTKQYIALLKGKNARDPFQVDPCKFQVHFDPSSAGDLDNDGQDDPFPAATAFRQVTCDHGITTIEPDIPANAADSAQQQETISRLRTAVRGAFKVPGLRNVELTGPYFHSGGYATLEQVVAFYNRGGDFARQNQRDLDPDIVPLGLSQKEQRDLVAFLHSLTDPRVHWEKAPFDHPQLFVPHGHPGDAYSVADNNGDWLADDTALEIPAIGAGGRPRHLGPLKTFEQVLR